MGRKIPLYPMRPIHWDILVQEYPDLKTPAPSGPTAHWDLTSWRKHHQFECVRQNCVGKIALAALGFQMPDVSLTLNGIEIDAHARTRPAAVSAFNEICSVIRSCQGESIIEIIEGYHTAEAMSA